MAKREKREEPLTNKNEVVFMHRGRKWANTPGHLHSVLQIGDGARITKGYDRYLAWCEANEQTPLAEEA